MKVFLTTLASAFMGGGAKAVVLFSLMTGLFAFGYGKGRVDAADNCRIADQQQTIAMQRAAITRLTEQARAADRIRRAAVDQATAHAVELQTIKEKSDALVQEVDHRPVVCVVEPVDARRLRSIR